MFDIGVGDSRLINGLSLAAVLLASRVRAGVGGGSSSVITVGHGGRFERWQVRNRRWERWIDGLCGNRTSSTRGSLDRLGLLLARLFVRGRRCGERAGAVMIYGRLGSHGCGGRRDVTGDVVVVNIVAARCGKLRR